MRIAVYGGSFNPPHVVHAMVARWVTWTGRADAVWLVPVFRHAFEGRHDKALASFEDRVAWTGALARDIGGGVEVCTIEAELPTPSYTIDTLRALRSRHPEHELHLVVGADVLDQVDRWRSWDAVEREFPPIIVGRQGYAPPPGLACVEFPGVSSTEIRDRLATGQSVDHLVTRSVLALLSGGTA